jgi:hypothetical protein
VRRGKMTKRSLYDLVNDSKYITVHADDRYLRGQTARVISKKVLKNIVSDQCSLYKDEKCDECFTQKEEVGCMLAWKLTVGKGKKLY